MTVLRRTLGTDSPELVVAEAGTLRIDLSTTAMDVLTFETLAVSSLRDDLAAAANLYRGEFLAGFPALTTEFGDWLAIQRRRFAKIAEDVLLRLAQAAADENDRAAALRAAERLFDLDPLREDGHRLLIRLYAEVGQRAQALRHAALCAAILERELGIPPEAETTALVEQIRADAARQSRPLPGAPSGATIRAVAVPPLPEVPRRSFRSAAVAPTRRARHF